MRRATASDPGYEPEITGCEPKMLANSVENDLERRQLFNRGAEDLRDSIMCPQLRAVPVPLGYVAQESSQEYLSVMTSFGETDFQRNMPPGTMTVPEIRYRSTTDDVYSCGDIQPLLVYVLHETPLASAS